jgi:hypothetical protein
MAEWNKNSAAALFQCAGIRKTMVLRESHAPRPHLNISRVSGSHIGHAATRLDATLARSKEDATMKLSDTVDMILREKGGDVWSVSPL